MHFGLPGTIRDADTDYRTGCLFCGFSCYEAFGLLAMKALHGLPVVGSAGGRRIQRHHALTHGALWLENDGAGRSGDGVRPQRTPPAWDRQGTERYGATGGAGKFQKCWRSASHAGAVNADDPFQGRGRRGEGQGGAVQGNLVSDETAMMTKTVETGGFSDDGRASSYSGCR